MATGSFGVRAVAEEGVALCRAGDWGRGMQLLGQVVEQRGLSDELPGRPTPSSASASTASKEHRHHRRRHRRPVHSVGVQHRPQDRFEVRRLQQSEQAQRHHHHPRPNQALAFRWPPAEEAVVHVVDTREVNRVLAQAAERAGIGMGVGSQRAALANPALEDTFAVVRDEAPRAFIAANIGIVQLRDHGLEWADRAVEMIDADAIAIHLNFLQEALQPEGDHDARGCLPALEELCRELKSPVIVKETGSGISAATVKECWNAGAGAIDIGGWGGTNWAAVEGLRREKMTWPEYQERPPHSLIFEDWGIPTVVSLCEVAGTGGPVIATGGIRSGLDMAKAIALGADLCGIALPLLAPAMRGENDVTKVIAAFTEELRVAMVLSGAKDLNALKDRKPYITGRTRQMLKNNGGI